MATGAAVAGAFERADTGTILLDEVGELPLELQAKLLGVLESKSVQRVGGRAPVAVDVRVLCATNRELEREVNRGAFRADLFYRVAVIQVRLPPLRDRRDELPGGDALSPATLERLAQRDYTGNVRELRNALERVAVGLETLGRVPARSEVDLDGPFRLQKEKLIASSTAAKGT